MTWLLLVVVALIALSALFVAAEFSLVAARRTQIEPLAVRSARARSALAAMEEVSVMMACAQLGITACAVVLGAVGEPAIAHLLEPAFTAIGLPAAAVEPVALVVALLLVVFAHVAFGEMLPKNIALAGPERVAVALAPGLRALARMLGPIVRGLNHVANGVVRLVGLSPAVEVASTFNRAQVAALVAQSAREGLLDPEDEQLIGAALGFATGTVADLVVPDQNLITVGPDPSAADVERACARSGFSRFPVRGAPAGAGDEDSVETAETDSVETAETDSAETGGTVTAERAETETVVTAAGTVTARSGGTPDPFVGFVHVRDALRVCPVDRDEPLPAGAIRGLPVIGPAAGLRAALDLMRTNRVHMARVHGETGPIGVLMLEDVIEALVGDVIDATARGLIEPADRPPGRPADRAANRAANRGAGGAIDRPAGRPPHRRHPGRSA